MATAYTLTSFKVTLRWQLPLLVVPTVYWAIHSCNSETKLPENLLDSGNFLGSVLVPDSTNIEYEIDCADIALAEGTYYSITLAATPYAIGSSGLIDIKKDSGAIPDEVVGGVTEPNDSWGFSTSPYIGLKCYDGVDEFITLSYTMLSPISLTGYADAPRYFGNVLYFPPSSPTKAKNPTPIDTATDVVLNQATVIWEDGGGATSYNVYYGEDEAGLALVSEGQAGLSFTITGIDYGSPFEYLTSRAWRIDSINDAGPTTGDVWTFAAIAFDPPLPTGVTLDAEGEPTGTPTGESGMLSVRKLVVAANSKIWYEDI